MAVAKQEASAAAARRKPIVATNAKAAPERAATAPSGNGKIGARDGRQSPSPTVKTNGKPTVVKAGVESPPLAEPKRAPIPLVTHLPEGAIKLADDDEPVPKTRLTPKQLAEFRELLLKKRSELLNDVHRMTNEALGRNHRESSSNLSSIPIHMADLGTDNWEQEFTLGLIANENALLRDIAEALARIENRTYGICLATHRPITVARLRAQPWAKYCIEYARLQEKGFMP